MNMEVVTGAGRERYGISQDLDLRGFLLGRHQSRPKRQERAERADRGDPAIVFEVKRADDVLRDMTRALRKRDEAEETSGYQVRLQKWKDGVSIDFSASNTCADLLFLLLDEGFASEAELDGFVAALRAHRIPSYTQLYLLAKWAQRMDGEDARDVFQRLLAEKRRSYPKTLGADSDLFAGGGIALAGNGNYFFVYPSGGERVCCRYDWRPQTDSGYSVEFDLDNGRLLSIDGKKVRGEDADKLLAAGIGGRFAVRNRLRCVTCGAERRYETDRGELVAEATSVGRDRPVSGFGGVGGSSGGPDFPRLRQKEAGKT